MSNSRSPRVEIGVLPSVELEARPRLFAALERAYDVRFAPLESTAAPDALLSLGAEVQGDPDIPVLVLSGGDGRGDDRPAVEFTSAEPVPVPFRGRVLLEEDAHLQPVEPHEGVLVLARVGREAVWTADSRYRLRQRAAAIPAELESGERLRDRLRPGRFLALLPLLNYLNVLTDRTPACLQACFVVDDPNLHARRYGYVAYPALARHAEEHGYHIAMAMIPLDGWFASRSAVSLFREGRRRLSLAVHGNDHIRGELARAGSVADATAVAAQALRRVESFERRTGIPVSRVMVPPHSASSAIGARGLLRAGFASLCTNPAPHAPESDVALRDWRPADFVGGGLPNISRHHLGSPRDELAFRAFLGQPLVLYLHHGDLRGGLDVLAEAAVDVGRCGQVEWMPLGELAQRQAAMRVEGNTAVIRLFARRAPLQLPDGVTTLAVELPGHDEPEQETLALHIGDADELVQAQFRNGLAEVGAPASREVVATLRRRDGLEAASPRSSGTAVWPVLRRIVTEGRDRLAPLLP